MNEALKRGVFRSGPCDFFVAEQVFTLMNPVTMAAKRWHFGKPGVSRGSARPARQLTAAPSDRLFTA
jgi:hypothetical protein